MQYRCRAWSFGWTVPRARPCALHRKGTPHRERALEWVTVRSAFVELCGRVAMRRHNFSIIYLLSIIIYIQVHHRLFGSQKKTASEAAFLCFPPLHLH